MNKCILSFLFVAALFVSCETGVQKSDIIITDDKDCLNFIDFDAESNYYVLDILDDYPDSRYLMNECGKCTLLVSNKVYIDSVYHSGFKNMNLKYALDNNKKVAQVITIGIKNNDSIFEDVFQYTNPITKNEHGYGIYELKVQLEDCNVYYNKVFKNALRITFAEKDYGKGFRFWMFNLIKNKDTWKLVSKERVSTNKEYDYGISRTDYTDDYTNNCAVNENGMVLIDNDWLFRFF